MRHRTDIDTLPPSLSTLPASPDSDEVRTKSTSAEDTNAGTRSLSNAYVKYLDTKQSGANGGHCRTTIRNLSQQNVNDVSVAEFVGFTADGGPIVRFLTESPTFITDDAEFLGYFEDKKPIVAFRKGSIQFISDDQGSQEPRSPKSSPVESSNSSPV